jgi:hypothetical protein
LKFETAGASRRIAISESVLSDFNGLRRRFRIVAEALAARRAREAPVGLAGLSEKQYQASVGLARNCRFSQSASRRSTGRVRRSSGVPSDLINGTEYHSSEALDRRPGAGLGSGARLDQGLD